MNIGSYIKKFRLGKGMTQQDLANKLGVTKQSISCWERNEKIPSGDKVVEIMTRLDADSFITDPDLRYQQMNAKIDELNEKIDNISNLLLSLKEVVRED